MLKEVTKEEAMKAVVEGKTAIEICDIGSGDSVLATFNLTERMREITDYDGAVFLVEDQPKEKQPEKKKEEKKPEPKRTKTPPKEMKPEKKAIDKGKINALYRAGWSPGKIAEEMKITKPTVYRYLNILREEEQNADKGKSDKVTP